MKAKGDLLVGLQMVVRVFSAKHIGPGMLAD